MGDPVAVQYRAFIAYSHSDVNWAKWLHRWLEGFRADNELIGRDAAGTIHKTLRPICRDPDNTTAEQKPTEQTLAALHASRALIVICSPACATDQYVNEQIRLFKSRHPERPIIPLIIGGKPGDPNFECFPPSLKSSSITTASPEGPIELVAADAREQRDGKDRALATIVARLLSVSSEDVVERSERGFRAAKRESRRRALIARVQEATQIGIKGSIAAAIVALLAFSGALAYLNYQERRQIADIEDLVAKYGAMDSGRTSRPEIGPSVTDAISTIAQELRSSLDMRRRWNC